MSIEAKFDLIIVGAGPAGATCALHLRQSNLRILLIDKATFPRTKICGDAVVGRSIKTLFAVCPELVESFREFQDKTRINQTRLYMNNRKPVDIHWVNEAYCCTRFDFDNILIRAVKEYAPNVTVLEGFAVDTVENTEGGMRLGHQAKQQFFSAPLVVGCDGAQSILSKKLTDTKMSHKDHAGAVRTYFKGVKGLCMNRTEVFIAKKFSPGYLWVFPLSEDTANVGFGMLTQKISQKRINLRESMFQFIEESPILRERFDNSEQLGKVEGFGLPLGSRRVQISGTHFLLAGDAAAMIDPASGDGISNAIVSGKIAAETVLRAFQVGNFSASFLKQYDEQVFKMLGKELWQSTLLLRTSIAAPFILDVSAALMTFAPINRLVKKIL
ncbi:MAG: geranylgeranyl reductase family protein [Saprospiraceae bacterium]|nr:geranylgeranyl reductase family protein [Saprospiraceae bacterium]